MTQADYETIIQGWLDAGATDSSEADRAYANYLSKRLEAVYQQNYNATPTSENTSLTALRSLKPIAGTTGTAIIRAYLKETQILGPNVGATLRFAREIGLITASANNLRFQGQANGTEIIVTSASGVALPQVAANQFLRVRHRANTQGVKTWAQISSHENCALQAQAREDTVVSLRSGAVFARSNIEWELAAGALGTLARSQVTPFTLTVSSALPASIAPGDYVQVRARTQAPISNQPALAGYYKILQVFPAAVRLDPVPYTRVREGTFTQQASNAEAPTDVLDTVDWKIVRAQLNKLFVRHSSPLFSNVIPGDLVKITTADAAYILKVETKISAEILFLNAAAYTASDFGTAPYTPTGTTVGTQPTVSCTVAVTRAPQDELSLFAVQLSSTSTARVGDYVRLRALPASGPSALFNDKFFKIARLAGTVLHLDNEAFTLRGDALESAGKVYATFTAVVRCDVRRAAVAYPFSLYTGSVPAQPLYYRVKAVSSSAITLFAGGFYGYDEANFDIYERFSAPRITNLTALDDYFDVDVIQTDFNTRLFLNGTAVRLPTGVTLGDNDFVKVTTVSGNTEQRVHRVLSQPVPTVLLIAETTRTGQPLEGPQSSFAPYKESTQPPILGASGARAVQFSLVRVDASQYEKLTLTRSETFGPEVRAQDYVFLSAPNLSPPAGVVDLDKRTVLLATLAVFYARIAAVSTDRTTLTLSLATVYEKRANLLPTDAFGEIDLIAVTPLRPAGTSAFAAQVTATSLRPAANIDFVRAERLSAPAATPATPVYVRVNLAGTEYIFQSLGAAAGQNVVNLNPLRVTLANGLYVVGTSPYALTEQRGTPVSGVTVLTETKGLVDTATQLAAFNNRLPADTRAALDRALAQLYPLEAAANPQLAFAVFDALTAVVGEVIENAKAVSDTQVETSPVFKLRGADFVGGETREIPLETVTYLREAARPLDLQNETVRHSIAVLILASFTAQYLRGSRAKDLVKLKDLYIDASLRLAGYAALSANQAGKISVADKHKYAVQTFIAEKVKTSAAAAIAAVGRADLVSRVDLEVSRLTSALDAAIPASFGPNKRAFFVQDSASWNAAQIDAALPLYPGTLKTALASEAAVARRRGVQAFIAVPPEAPLRARLNNVARIRARQRVRAITLEDLRRHISQTTDAEVRQRAQAAAANVEARQQRDDDLFTATWIPGWGIVAPNPGPAPENDQQRVAQAAAEAVGPPSLRARRPVPPLTAIVTAPQAVAALPSAGKSIVSAPRTTQIPVAQPSGIQVTNLFKTDILDFRVISTALPLHTLNAAQFNASNYAWITLCDFDRRNSGSLPDHSDLEGFGSLPTNSQGVYYNQFKLTGFQESHAEKFQIVDTLADSFMAFAFGTRPEVWSISGILINDLVSQQLNKFRLFYEHYIRVSALAKLKKQMVLTVPALGIRVYGYAVAFVPQANPEVQTVVPFTLQILVAGIETLPRVVLKGNSVKASAVLSKLQQAARAVSGSGQVAQQPPANA